MFAPQAGAAALTVRAFFGDRPASEKFAIALCLSAAGIVAATAIAGFAGALTPGAIVCGGLVLLAASAVAARLAGPKEAPGFPSSARIPLPIMISAIIAAAALTVVYLWTCAAPPPPWDSFVYHLVFPARWLQEKEIFLITVPFGDQAGTYFPSNTELIYLFLMMPFREEFPAATAQFAFLLGAGALIWRLAVLGGRSEGSGLAAGLAAVVIPEILHQAAAPEVDVAFAFHFLAALFFLLSSLRDNGRMRYFILAAVAFGLLAGTKHIALVFGATLLPLAALCVLRGRAAVRAAVFIACAAAFGGFWYIRNWLTTGNPVFPLMINLGGIELFPGAYPRSTMLGSVFHTSDPAESIKAILGLAGVPLAVSAAGAALFGIRSVFSRKDFPLAAWYPLILPFVIFPIFVFVVPYNREGRFTFAALCLMCLFFAHALDGVGAASRAAAWLHPPMIAAALYWNKFFTWTAARVAESMAGRPSGEVLAGMRSPMLWALAAVAAAGAAYVARERLKTGGGRFAAAALLLISAASFCVYLSTMSAAYPKYKGNYYTGFPLGQAWAAFNMNARDATVAFTGTDLSFGLFGPGLRNRAVYVNVNRFGNYRFHEHLARIKKEGRWFAPPNDRINFHREDPDYNGWLANLRAAKADFLFASVIHQTDRGWIPHDKEFFPIERAWADSHPETFRPVWGNSQTRIYRIDAD